MRITTASQRSPHANEKVVEGREDGISRTAAVYSSEKTAQTQNPEQFVPVSRMLKLDKQSTRYQHVRLVGAVALMSLSF